MSALETFVQFLKNLEHQWDALLKKSDNCEEKSFNAEFNQLIPLTIESCLDFRNVQSNAQVEETLEKIRIKISSLKVEEGFNQAINDVLNTDKWNTPFGQWLLSGKLIGSSNRLVTFDNKLLYESDAVISARLESLMRLFQQTTSDDTGQMILNVFETYRKFILRDVKFQCKLSSSTVEKLLNYYMIAVCHRKSSDHLTSLIKLFPNHRKISYIFNLDTQLENGTVENDFNIAYKLQIAQEFIRDLLECEFQKPQSQQDIKNYNLFLQQLIDLATRDKKIEDDLESIVLSANDMNVISDYYYLAATQLRLRMPNKYNLIVKLISIGISHDFSLLQELKTSVDPAKDKLESDYKAAYRRVYLALIILGCIIKDYALRRLCFQSASFCEDKTESCRAILKQLPELETVDQGDNLDPVLLDIRYLLETFQYDIKDRTQLTEIYEKFSSESYDKLDYFNRTADFSEDLEPLHYPGVEKYMKKQAIEEKEHISQTSDLDKCLVDISEFNEELASRFKHMRNLVVPMRKQKLPSDEQIDLKIKQILSKCKEFRMSACGDIFYEMSSISFDEISSPEKHWENMKVTYNELNKDNLLFKFDAIPTITDEDLDVNLMYNSGTVDVINLYYKGYSTYDIENIMLYTIMEKKMKFISEEFAFLNKNRNVEMDEEQNQVHACFLYLANRPHPEYARLMRLSSTLRRFNNPIEYNIEYNTFDAAPGKYKYRQKNKVYKDKTLGENGSDSLVGTVTKMEVDHSKSSYSNEAQVKRVMTMPVMSNHQPSLPVAKSNNKKEKIPPAINLAGIPTFNTSDAIKQVFKNLQLEIASMIQKDVFIDTSKISDISSPHLVQCTTEIKSVLPAKMQSIRNGNISPREMEREISLPINVSGKLAIVLEFRDEIKYDEFFESPYIHSTLSHRVMSNIVIDNVTHNAKCDIDCIIEGVVSKIRVQFQGHKAYRPRKKVQKPAEISQAEQQVPQQPPANVKMEIDMQPNSNNIPSVSNIVMNVNSNINSSPAPIVQQDPMHSYQQNMPLQPQQQQQQIPYSYPINNHNPIASIGTNQYNAPPVSQQYSSNIPTQYPPPCYAQSTESMNSMPQIHSSVIQAPQHYTNGLTVPPQQPLFQQQQQPTVLQDQEPYICNANPACLTSPNRTKPKVEILAIENVSSVSLPNLQSPHNRPKISFSNPCIVPKEEPADAKPPSIAVMTIEKPAKQEIKNDDDLVDFEDEIQTTMVASTVPKKPAEKRNVASLPKSPPPLHYPTNNVESNLLATQPTIESNNLSRKVSSPVQQSLPTRPNVIKSPVPRQQQFPVDESEKHPEKKIKLMDNRHKIDLTKNFSEIIEREKRKLDEKQNSPDVIDLTDDINEPKIDLTKDFFARDRNIRVTKRAIPEITFIECDTKSSSEQSSSTSSSSEENAYKRTSIERVRKKITKRSGSRDSLKSPSSQKCKVYLVDVMKDINKQYLKKDVEIRLKKTLSTPQINQRGIIKSIRHAVAEELPSEEQPHESFVDTAYDATFTIVCHNSVSYTFNDSFGDGIANVTNRYSKCKTNNNNNTNITANCSYSSPKQTKQTNIDAVKNKFKVLNYNNNDYNNNNNANGSNLGSFYKTKSSNADILSMLKLIEQNYFKKPTYSDRNHLNFTKNLKNRKKFSRWTPKECNFNIIDIEKKENNNDKSIFDDEKNHKSLLYQVSHAVMNSIPGLNSLEFFKIPPTPQRRLQIEVVHLKEIKSSTSSSETSDGNDGAGNEPGNSMHTDGNNIESISNSTTIHIQKIGQTSISHETETRTLQTSFGSIIKNTYPPATSRVVLNNSDIMKTEKLIKLKQDDSNVKKISISTDSPLKNASNVKIIACSSQSQMSDASKSINKNQTLINMLTQQVMVPTNSNRHYIITSAAKQPDVKVENVTGTSCTLTSNNAINTTVRKTVTTTGQSQLVQILNSPPTNFTMKSLNVLSSANPSNSKPSQIMAVSSPANVDGMKAELPDSIKQQGVVQFICKTDGKIIHLTPICNSNSGTGITKKITYKVDTSGAKGPTILHHANQQIILNNQLRKEENPNILTIIQKQASDTDKKPKNTLVGITQSSNPSSPMGTRSVYEETYAKFIQTPSVGITSSSASDMGLLTISSTPVSSNISGTTTNTFIQKIGKTVIQSSNQILPKFNQAFGKSIFSSTTLTDQSKAATTREAINRSVVNAISPVKVTKNEKNEISFISESEEKPLPTLQSALQGNNLLYARPIGNGKLIASNNNNVLLTALRSNSNQTNNVRIITTIADSMSNANRTIMTPVRISVPIQIPQLINSVRPQSPGNFRPQIVIAPAGATTVVRPQSNIQNLNQSGSKLQSLLMGSQQTTTTTATINHQPEHAVASDVVENVKVKVEQKPKKTVDNSTLEQLREFDMVLEQVLERSSVTPNSVASPPPDTSNHSSPRKQVAQDNKMKIEIKSSSVSIASNSPSDSPTSSKSLSSTKTTPKLQEDEHTAQRILDILANYKEQVRNSPDLNNKPAPRRRANPPTNPPAKRKKIAASTSTGNIKNSKQFGSSSDVMTDTMGSEEDSSCGVGSGVASTGSINNSPRGDIDDHTDVSMDNNFYMEDTKREIALSPQSSNSSVTTSPAHNKFSVNRRSLVIESKNNSGSESVSSKSFILNNSQSSTSSASSVTRTSIGESVEQRSTTAVLMPGNYILPMNVLKGGQHLAILSSNNGQKIIAVPASQLTSPVSINNSSGTSIILQRYVNQMNEASGLGDKAVLTHSGENDGGTAKTLQFHQQNNSSIGQNNKIFVKSLDEDVKSIKQENDTYESSSSNNFVSDKTLITEIIQQQQQLSHNHPQHNFMIKLNEPSDPKSSSSIMFMGDAGSSSTDVKNEVNDIKIKTEKLDYDGCIKEEMMDLNNEHEMLNSPMLNTKMEVDENTSSNHDTSDADNSHSQKLPQFPSILSSCLTKQTNSSANTARNNTKGFLIDPSSKILMYNDRKQATSSTSTTGEIFNQKSFSEECADLGVDEPIASDLFPEADLLFDSGSPKFDQINPNDGNIQIKRELENGEVLLQMNYNNNMSEPWLNFDTEDELVDDSHGESSDDQNNPPRAANGFN